MNRGILAAVLMLFSINIYAGSWTGNVNFLLGQKSLETDDWGDLDKQAAFGVFVDFGQSDWPVSIAIDVLGTYDETTDTGINIEGSTSEIDAGIRKIWKVSNTSMRPYIGGGLALVGAELKATGPFPVSDDDTGVGLWLNGGVYWTLGQSFNIGLDLRYSDAEVTLFGVDGEAGGTTAGLLLGYHW